MGSAEIPLTLQHALELLGLDQAPSDPLTRRIMMEGLEENIRRHGEEWIVQNRERLKRSLEIVDSM